ncbi:hypothetical protein AgCh_031071 [Apium graveolens]
MDDVSFLIGGDDPYDDNVVLRNLYHSNLNLLLVIEGSEGCRYYTKEFKGRVSGLKVKVVHTTGVGDAFVGAILNNLASDWNLYMVNMLINTQVAFVINTQVMFGGRYMDVGCLLDVEMVRCWLSENVVGFWL